MTSSGGDAPGAAEDLTFHWADYTVFILSLVISGSVGIIQGIVDHVKAGKSKEKEAKVGERNISVWPASLSVMASTLAAPFVLGVPGEIYASGTEFSLLIIGYAVGIPLCTHLFYTRFYDLGVASVYEYLEFRFSRTIRSLCTFIFAFSIVIYLGIITYAPAVAFSQVTGLSMQVSVLGVAIIGIIYTVIGGLKGVIWVDAIQMLIIIVGSLAILIKGTIDVGGMGRVWQLAQEGGRIQFDVFDPRLTVRHSFWTQSIGGIFALIVIFTNQAIVQKFLGLPTKKKMFITSYASMFTISGYLTMACLTGVVMFAYYSGCSPICTGLVMKPDQVLPLFVLQLFKGIYGIPGLFTASVFSASLSSVAGGINALAAVTILDVINPLCRKYRAASDKFEPKQLLLIFKGLVLLYGLITIGFAYLAPFLGSGLLQLALNLMGVVGAPMFSLFIMGIYMPCINSWGAGFGLLISLVVMMWISLGAILTTGKYKLHLQAFLPFRTDQCPAGAEITNPICPRMPLNMTQAYMTSQLFDSSNATADVYAAFVANADASNATTAAVPVLGSPSGIEVLYTVSYMWYYVIAVAISLVVAFLVSLVTGFRKGEPVDTALSFPCCYKVPEEKLVEDDEYPVYPGKLDATHVNPAFTYPNGIPMVGEDGAEKPVDVEGPIGAQFEEYDDTGTYGYGIFNRNRCSKCRMSRIVHCTKL